MLFVFACYTVLIVFLNICADVSTNLINPSDIPKLTPQDIRDRVWGSKCVLIVESMMCAVQWGTKACLLMLYYRLTENLRQRIVVQIAAVYSVVTYIVMISLYYGYWCRPFRAFWETPTPHIQCATQTNHLIVNLTFNLTSDLMIIFIPLPLFIKAHLDLKKKLLLVFPFSLGFFTMVCAILSKHLSFTEPFSSEWLFWYTREASTAVIVSNMPYSWTVVRKVFKVKAFLRPGGSDTDIGENASGRHMSSTDVPTRGTQRGSDVKSLSGKTLSNLNPFSHRPSMPRHNSGTPQSPRPPSAIKESFAMVSWKRTQYLDGKGAPLSTSTSSEDSGQRSVKSAGYQPPISDVDRLYRLDDEDLEMTECHDGTQRQYEP